MRLSLTPTLGLDVARGIGQRMGQRAGCIGCGVGMCAQVGARGDVAGQRSQPARAVAKRLGLLAQAQRDLAEECRQPGEQARLQQRRSHCCALQQRRQQRERADATGQPYRQAITMAQQHAQQQCNRQRR